MICIKSSDTSSPSELSGCILLKWILIYHLHERKVYTVV